MAAPNEYYVDPLNGDDTTGDGLSDGTAWKTFAKAVSTISRDATNGDRINVKDSATDTLSSAQSIAGSGPAPWIIQGYTATAGDGGIGVLSGGGSVGILSNATGNGVIIRDMELTNTGAADIVILDDFCRFENVYFHNTTGDAVDCDIHCVVANCRFENIGGVGVRAFDGIVFGSYFGNGTNDFTDAINFSSGTNVYRGAYFCIFNLDGTSNGISDSGSAGFHAAHNSFFTSGTGSALDLTTDAGAGIAIILNNLFEGWNIGVDLSAATTQSLTILAGNAGFDNVTDFDDGDTVVNIDNESLGATPFAKSGAATYANRATYFTPVDTGNVLSPHGGLTGAKGAVQPGFLAGGGGAPLIGGGLVQA